MDSYIPYNYSQTYIKFRLFFSQDLPYSIFTVVEPPSDLTTKL
ncbi:hypothetical protein LINPERPRIM_LOCUS18939, partial [Linum perenne]